MTYTMPHLIHSALTNETSVPYQFLQLLSGSDLNAKDANELFTPLQLQYHAIPTKTPFRYFLIVETTGFGTDIARIKRIIGHETFAEEVLYVGQLAMNEHGAGICCFFVELPQQYILAQMPEDELLKNISVIEGSALPEDFFEKVSLLVRPYREISEHTYNTLESLMKSHNGELFTVIHLDIVFTIGSSNNYHAIMPLHPNKAKDFSRIGS